MNENEKYAEVMKELGKSLKNKNETIALQEWQIANLTKKVEELEKQLKASINYGVKEKIEYRN